ncbi:hypothetical protein CPB83DRAFT_844621 [Crepidotus variabilis]|uniref:Uncharacterized protein n=1 Tax=Crepidotus variabilis TaxID=179855 RepID=A0A9P6ES35_9AGAR|nr:hypothetical protein CPB83DRAFT_844621 [Crepidotus variabilis]
MSTVKQWVERSGRCPLSVGIWAEAVGQLDTGIAWPALQMFTTPNEMEITSRIQDILIRASNVFVSEKDEAPSGVQFPALRTLNVCFEGHFWDVSHVTDGNFDFVTAPRFLEEIPVNAPHLESLTWRGFNCTQVLSNLLHPPSNLLPQAVTLTNIEIEATISPLECFDILASFPHLRYCVLEGIRKTADVQLSFHHSSLDVFYLAHLTLIGDFNPLFILNKLTAPSLCVLTIAAVNGSNIQSSSTLSSFLLQSTPPLRELRITNIHLPEEECQKCFRSIPTMEILDIYHEHRNRNGPKVNGILDALLMRQPPFNSTAPFVCPKLRSLVIRGDVVAPDGVLAEFVEGRLGETGIDFCLEKVHVEFNEEGHNIDKEKVKELTRKAERLEKKLVMRVFHR